MEQGIYRLNRVVVEPPEQKSSAMPRIIVFKDEPDIPELIKEFLGTSTLNQNRRLFSPAFKTDLFAVVS